MKLKHSLVEIRSDCQKGYAVGNSELEQQRKLPCDNLEYAAMIRDAWLLTHHCTAWYVASLAL